VKWLYVCMLLYVGLHLTDVDRLRADNNACERTALQAIAAAPGKVVQIDQTCNVMSWEKISNPFESRFNAQLLFHWHIIPEIKYYYQK